jgi:hypothetical protein
MRFDMRVAEVRVVRAAFGDVLGAMREWLDRNDGRPAHFETAADDGGSITIKVRFDSDDLAETFRRTFNASYGIDFRTSARDANTTDTGAKVLGDAAAISGHRLPHPEA